MAQIGAVVVPTLESASTRASAYMLGFNVLVKYPSYRTERFQLSFRSLTFCSFPFSSTASLATLVPTTIQSCLAQPATLRRVIRGFVANDIERISTTLTSDRNLESTRLTIVQMTGLSTRMTARQYLPALLLTTWDGVCA